MPIETISEHYHHILRLVVRPLYKLSRGNKRCRLARGSFVDWDIAVFAMENYLMQATTLPESEFGLCRPCQSRLLLRLLPWGFLGLEEITSRG
jgi:hypothetical protein